MSGSKENSCVSDCKTKSANSRAASAFSHFQSHLAGTASSVDPAVKTCSTDFSSAGEASPVQLDTRATELRKPN